jgi:hypothetical protein
MSFLDIFSGCILDGFSGLFKHQVDYALLIDHQFTEVLAEGHSSLENFLFRLACFLGFNWRHVNLLVHVSSQLATLGLILHVS